MHKFLRLLVLASLASFGSQPVLASDAPAERPSHYQAKKADSIAETIKILRETNAQLSELLAGEMGDYDINDVHSLSYTLEDALLALAKEAQALHKVVADMHFSSEGLDRDAVIDYGNMYLRRIQQIV
ncbi:MAG: hypothetical protein RBR77_09685, partial [Thauera sp.]|nr:hypothetical protein [Thauera sp.]